MPSEVASEPQLTLDALLRVRYGGVECVVDLEAEARARPEIGRRLFEYGARASIVTGLPVLSIVIFLLAGGSAPKSPYVMRAGTHRIATWEYTGIELYKQDAEALLARGTVGILPLIAFANGGDQEAVLERAMRTIAERAPRKEARELEAWLVIFAARRTDQTLISALLRRLPEVDELVTESPIYQMWVSQAEARGEARGKAEGKAEGEAETARKAVRVMLEGRFGSLPSVLSAAIDAASVDALMDVLAHGAVESLDALATRLGVTLGE